MRSFKNSEPRPPIMEGSPPPQEWRCPPLDWDRPPWNRWAFQNVSQILRTAPIRRGAEISDLPANHQDLGDVIVPTEWGARTLDQFLDDSYCDGLLVMRDGKVVAERYFNRMTPRTLHLLQSVSKSITATTAACLFEDGLMDPMAPIETYLPELARTAYRGARVRDILDMSSGVAFDEEDYANRESDIGKMDVAAGWKPAPEGVDCANWPTCIWEQITGLTVQEAPHGSRFLYRSIETDTLAHAMERATGKRLPDLISDRLWAPMGAEADAAITVDSSGYGLACGGVTATLRDMGRFAQALLNDGLVAGRRVIPSAWIEDIRRGDHGHFNDYGRRYFPNGRYRNQFWIEDRDRPAHLCLGVFGQSVYVNPDTGLAAVKLSTWPDFTDPPLQRATLAAFHAIEAALGA